MSSGNLSTRPALTLIQTCFTHSISTIFQAIPLESQSPYRYLASHSRPYIPRLTTIYPTPSTQVFQEIHQKMERPRPPAQILLLAHVDVRRGVHSDGVQMVLRQQPEQGG